MNHKAFEAVVGVVVIVAMVGKAHGRVVVLVLAVAVAVEVRSLLHLGRLDLGTFTIWPRRRSGPMATTKATEDDHEGHEDDQDHDQSLYKGKSDSAAERGASTEFCAIDDRMPTWRLRRILLSR